MFGTNLGFGAEAQSTAAPKYEVFNASQSGTISGTQGGPGGRTEERTVCLPLTVRIVEDALERQRMLGTDELRVHGVDVGQSSMMLFVGAVEQLVKQASSVQFVLNDSTGRIKVRHFTSTDAGTSDLDQVVDGGYLTIVGSVRSSPALHVSAAFLHPVSSANEISYHLIEAAHAGLRLQKAVALVPLTTPTKPNEILSNPGIAENTPPKEAASELSAQQTPEAAPVLTVPVSKAPDSSTLKRAVHEFLRREAEGTAAGLHIDAVCVGVKADATAVREALQALVEDGDVYTTINEDNFAPL